MRWVLALVILVAGCDGVFYETAPEPLGPWRAISLTGRAPYVCDGTGYIELLAGVDTDAGGALNPAIFDNVDGCGP